MQANRKRGRPPSATSIRAIATHAHVSERSLYYARQLSRSGRTDLIQAVERGEKTITAAIRELTGARLPNRYDKLVLAWNRCDDKDQARFLLVLVQAGLVTLKEDP